MVTLPFRFQNNCEAKLIVRSSLREYRIREGGGGLKGYFIQVMVSLISMTSSVELMSLH